MPSDFFGSDEAAVESLPEPPAPEGMGLFGEPTPPPPAAAPPPAPVIAAPANTPYRVLARKYRPQTFADLIGQEAMVRTLRNAFAQDRVAHAFMLTGVRGVGKTTTARIVARALNCIGADGTGGPTVEPCGVCAECRDILADRHPDVIELDAASNNGVENVREIREQVRFRPSRARFKIYILDEVHMLSGPAFNALLKTLEEPPPAVKFLFATTELRKVPATILSRCQTFHLKRVPQTSLATHFTRIAGLEGASLEPEALAMIARAADGSVRDGLSLLDQAIALAGPGQAVATETVRDMLGLAGRDLVFDLMEALVAGDVATALTVLGAAHERGADPAVVLADLADLTHTLTRMVAVPALRDDASLPEAERTRGAALAAQLDIPSLTRLWQMLLKGLGEFADAVDRRATAEMVVIRLAYAAALPPPGEVLRRLDPNGAASGRGAPAPSGGGGGPPPLRAMQGGGGAALAVAVPLDVPAMAAPRAFRDVVALASGRAPLLHAMLVQSVHLVGFAEGRIELRPRPEAPRDFASQLAAMLLETTGRRWTITLSNDAGEATLAEQSAALASDRHEAARAHPLVQAILAVFPTATIGPVRDERLDAYGLIAEETPEPDFPDFAPPDASGAWDGEFPDED
ncbi:DNA polymerase III subunit gamma/tau [Humitalea sp. 24SJ18S-53]|uniref:DNA polymerase III subunit gamma/tau n=1 Tax=Humitalea sp. 24SJ18S-53 TaxID=3422307 RepID=UPI003D6717A4